MKKYSLLPQQKLGEYTLLERIGSGGFGEVWKAKKEDFFFALKIALNKLCKRFDKKLINRRIIAC